MIAAAPQRTLEGDAPGARAEVEAVIAKQIVELHDGTVEVVSAGAGTGTEAVVRLPLAPGAQSSASGPKDAGQRPGQPTRDDAAPHDRARGSSAKRRVLVVDDNTDAVLTLRDALELFGHVVEVAYDGPEALAVAREFRPEAVLCDIGLPGMDGCEVAARLRADPELRSAFLVALTGYSLPSDLARSQEAGFDRHLVKPPNLSELHELLVALPTCDREASPRQSAPDHSIR